MARATKKELEKIIRKQASDIHNLSKDVSKLTKENDSSDQQLIFYTKITADANREIRELNTLVSKQKEDIQKLINDISYLKIENTDLRDDLKQHNKIVELDRTKNEVRINIVSELLCDIENDL